MTRTEAIARIKTQLETLDDTGVRALADFANSLRIAPLELTAEEQAALDRSRDDFKAGRVLDEEQYDIRMDAFMARLRAKAQQAG